VRSVCHPPFAKKPRRMGAPTRVMALAKAGPPTMESIRTQLFGNMERVGKKLKLDRPRFGCMVWESGPCLEGESNPANARPLVQSASSVRAWGHGAPMTSKDNVSHFYWRALRAIGLCGTLAFVISVASPIDDDVQQESAPSRRHQSVTLSKATHPADGRARNASAVVPTPVISFFLPTTDATAVAMARALPSAIQAYQTGDRSPPVVRL
jgi:hypothetical protein